MLNVMTLMVNINNFREQFIPQGAVVMLVAFLMTILQIAETMEAPGVIIGLDSLVDGRKA